MALADDIAQIRRFAAVEEAMTPEERAIVTDRINERFANRRTGNDDLAAAIAQATIDEGVAHGLYDALVAFRDTPVTGVAAVNTTAHTNLTNINQLYVDKQGELDDLRAAQGDPGTPEESIELVATQYVAAHHVPPIDIPYK